jgi:hypothetical protein
MAAFRSSLSPTAALREQRERLDPAWGLTSWLVAAPRSPKNASVLASSSSSTGRDKPSPIVVPSESRVQAPAGVTAVRGSEYLVPIETEMKMAARDLGQATRPA